MGLFVGIGVGSYDQDQHPALPRAVPDVTEFAERLSGHFVETVLIDPDEEAVRKRLRRLAGEADGALVLLWAGHGTGDPAHLVLLASDSRAVPNDGFDATQVARACAGSGASQILLILDTCYSGGGLPAATVAAEVLHQLPVDHDHMWVGVLTSCAAVETAQDGLLGERLRMLLDRGPRQPVLRVRWSVHNRFIRGDDLCDALIKEWDSDRQTPQFQGRGSAWWMFPNPLYDPGAPEQVVEHLLWAARSSGRGDERSWFTGRTIEVNQVVEWVRSGEPGVYVVTGSPGTGKSAITGRVVSLSNPHERDRLLTEGRRWEHDDPGERSVRAHLHARGLSVDQAADLIAGQLVAGGLLPAQEARRNAAELVGQVQRVVEAGTAPPVIVVDGVDEARGEAFALADELLTRLARFAVVVVSTRDLPRLGGGAGLVSTLSPGGPGIDLDAADARDRTARDVVEYVSARLAGVDPAMDPMSVAEQVGAGVAADRGRTGRPFLLARLVADQLSASPVDTTDPAWRDRVAISVEQAFDHDMSMISAPPSGSALLMNDHVAGARALLTALTRAYGAGLPEEEWLAIANATRSPETRFDRDDLSWVLDQLGRYVIQDSEYGTAVYRVAHQSLADHLRPPFRSSHQQPFDPGALPIAESLTALYRTKIDAGLAVDGPVYLWRYLWRHASDAGPEGLGLLRGLAEINASLAGYLAAAALAISERHSQWGYWHEAVGPTEGAVSLFRMLAADNPAFLPDLTGALNNLGNCYSNVGRLADAVAPTEEAVTLLRALAADNPAFVHDLAMALNNLGNCYSDVGRRLDAIAPTEEAVTLLRALATDNPAFLPNLAMTLNNLGNHYSRVGRRQDAIAPTEEAVTLRRALATDNPAFLPDLAMTLNNLGSHYSRVGRRQDAIAPTEEAVTLRRALATDNPAFLPNLAMALNNLSISYSDVGRRQDAIAPGEEAVTLQRALAADNPAFLPDLATALNNLGNRYSDVGRRQDAIAPTEEALTLLRALAADNPAFLPDLASTLINLGISYSDVGRRQDAIAPTEEGLTLYRTLAADNPAFLPDLAMALNSLGSCYSDVGRRQDAIAPGEEAVTLLRALATDNPAFLPNLATTLNNLGNHYSNVGGREEAIAPTEEAVSLRRALATDNPAFLPDLAVALTNLGTHYSNVGRSADAIASTEEAAALLRALATDNPAFLPNLAMTLNNLGNHYSNVGRSADAIASTEEAATLLRALATDNPAFLPNLAMALNNLGNHYSNVRRPADAIAPTEEAVVLYRTLAAENPAVIPDLASALNNLGTQYNNVGIPSAVESRWQATLIDLPDSHAAYLYFARAAAAQPGTPAAADWVISGLRLAAGTQDLLGALHEQARRHRDADPDSFDRTWAATGDEPPDWLDVEPGLLATARAWIETPTFPAERDHLAGHPELLDADADVAVAEALLAVDEQEAGRYHRLRENARAQGVDEAYRPLLLRILAAEFVGADPVEQAAMLSEHHDDLLTESVRDTFAEIAEGDESGMAERADAIIALAQIDAAGPALEALVHPEQFAGLLATIAESADTTGLEATAFLAGTITRTDEAASTADFYSAVAAALADDLDTAAELLNTARRRTPDQTNAWIVRLAEIGRRHPAALSLIAVLTTPPEGTE